MSAPLRFLVFRFPALAYMAFIFYMSSGPVTSDTLHEVPDYLLHTSGYVALYVLVFWAVHEGIHPSPGRGGFWLPAVVTILYGISDEYHQGFIPTRDSSWRDVGADAMGALLGIPAIVAAGRLKFLSRKR
jgi:VanZ family protein